LKRGLSCFSGARRRVLERFDLMGTGEGLHVTTRYHNVSVLKGFMFWLIRRRIGLESMKAKTVMRARWRTSAILETVVLRLSSFGSFFSFQGIIDGGYFKISWR